MGIFFQQTLATFSVFMTQHPSIVVHRKMSLILQHSTVYLPAFHPVSENDFSARPSVEFPFPSQIRNIPFSERPISRSEPSRRSGSELN